jgi:hypothetical protein
VLLVSSLAQEAPSVSLVRELVDSEVVGTHARPLYVAAMGATFAFTESFVANQRKKDDYLNGVAGGCAAGFLAGIKCMSLLAVWLR